MDNLLLILINYLIITILQNNNNYKIINNNHNYKIHKIKIKTHSQKLTFGHLLKNIQILKILIINK